MSQAFKRRGNMSCDDSRAGNATSECAPVWNRVRDEMRIVCLIAVGAFLLTIAVAEGDVPMGIPQYHQRVIRPIILEPVKRYHSNEEGPLNWFFKMVSRVVEPPKKVLPTMIGPLNLPGMQGQVFIRQVENTSPWGANHVVIRMVTRDPITGLTMPMDTSSMAYNRLEDSSRRVVKPYNYQPMKQSPARPNNVIQQGFVPSPVTPAYPSWSGPYRQRPQQYSQPYPKPQRPSSPNDFRYENYGKQAGQSFPKEHPDNYPPQRPFRDNYQPFQPNPGMANQGPNGPGTSIASPSLYRTITQQVPRDHDYSSNEYNVHRFKDNVRNTNSNGPNFFKDQSGSSESAETAYPDYPSPREDELRSSVSPKYGNDSHDIEDDSADNFQGSAQYRTVVRADRMVPVAGNHRNKFGAPTSRTRMAKHQDSRGSKDSRGFRSAAKFDSEGVGGIEVIAAPNLKIGWDNDVGRSGKNKVLGRSSGGNPRGSDDGLNEGEDSMSMGNGRNLARGESAEHVNEQPEMIIEKPTISRRVHSRMSSYSTIDRARRRQGSRNSISTTESQDRSDEESSQSLDRSNEESSESLDRSNEESSESVDRFDGESSESLDRFNKKSSESLDRSSEEPSISRDYSKNESSETSDRFNDQSSESLDRFNKKSSESLNRSTEEPSKSRHHSKNESSESSDRFNDQSSTADRVEDKKSSSIEKNKKPDESSSGVGKIERTTRMSNVTAEVVQKVMKLTARNSRRLPERRKPRVIKAIYRRKPRTGIIKSSRQSARSKDSSEVKSSSETSTNN